MEMLTFVAMLVGGATILGAAMGLVFKTTSQKFNDGAMSVAAGLMLAAAVLGLIIPSLECGGKFGVFTTILGIFSGALCVNLFDIILLRSYERWGVQRGQGNERFRRVILFVAAIALHNLPEGMAAGVGFGGGDIGDGLFIATAIALQNIPEGMTVTIAVKCANMKPRRAFLIAAMTGVVEIIATFIGYFAVSISEYLLPFILAFAGGNMLYVIADEMIPETHSGGEGHSSAYLILLGFCLMLILNALI